MFDMLDPSLNTDNMDTSKITEMKWNLNSVESCILFAYVFLFILPLVFVACLFTKYAVLSGILMAISIPVFIVVVNLIDNRCNDYQKQDQKICLKKIRNKGLNLLISHGNRRFFTFFHGKLIWVPAPLEVCCF